MKKLFYLLLLLFSFSQNIEAQIFEVDPYENVPKGENVIFTDVMPWKTNGIKYPIVVTQKHAYVNAREIYFSDELDIIDASYKLTFGGLKEQRFLVLLSDRSVIELRPTNISIKWAQKSLGKLPANANIDEILGDDLYVKGYNTVYVSDSGFNWALDTVGLNKPSSINDIAIDTMQRVWLCTSNGLFTQELNATTWIKNTNYVSPGCEHVFVDRLENIWVTYYNTIKVSRNRGASFQNGPTGLPSAFIRDVCDDQLGNIYVMFDNRIYFSASGTQAFVQIGQSILADFTKYPHTNIYNDIIGDSLIYLSTDADVYTSADQGLTWTANQSVPAAHYNSVAATTTNQLLMTTNNGLFRLESDQTTWTKRYPSTGFIVDTRVYTATNGDLYLLAERAGMNSGGNYRKMVYKSTDHGNTFMPDSAGMGAGDVAMNTFFVDESGTLHAASNVYVTGTGYVTRIWEKPSGQSWMIDTTGLPSLTNINTNPRCFGSGNNGKVYLAIMNNGNNTTTIYSSNLSGGAWSLETVVGGFVYDVKGNNGIVTVGCDEGIKYNNGTGWKTASLPAGVSTNIIYCASAVGANKVAWAYFEKYVNSESVGQGIYYTTDFTTWKKPVGSKDTTLFNELYTIGDSVFVTTYANAGIYLFDTVTTNIVTGINSTRIATSDVKALPNPFKDKVILQFEMKNDAPVSVSIYNMLGQIVFELPVQNREAGLQKIEINLPPTSKGFLIYNLKIGDEIMRGKMVRE